MSEIKSVKDLILAASGLDNNRLPKSQIGLTNETWYLDGSSKVNDEISSNAPTVNIFKNSGYVQVDLDFRSKSSIDLKLCWKFISKYTSPENSVDDKTDAVPNMVLSIIPVEFDGDYYMLCINPIFTTLQPADSSGEPCVIRMVFTEDNFLCYSNKDEN